MQAGREVKYQVWVEPIKEMKKVTALLFDDDGQLFGVKTPDSGVNACLSLHTVRIRQFTGLCDKNGQEIYEGDILADCVEGSTICGYVVKQKGAFFLETGQTWAPYLHVIATKHNEIGEWEVIGNIYGNPEIQVPNGQAILSLSEYA